MRRGIEVMGVGLALAGTLAACSNDREPTDRQLGRSAEAAPTERTPDRPNLPACKFSVGFELAPVPGADAPAEWVYPGIVDTEGKRVVRPVMRGNRESYKLYSAKMVGMNVLLTELRVDKATRWFATDEVANGAGDRRPSSYACAPSEKLIANIPPAAEAITLEGGTVKVGGATGPRFELGYEVANGAKDVYDKHGVGIIAAKASSKLPSEDMPMYSHP